MSTTHTSIFAELMASAVRITNSVSAAKTTNEGWSPIVILGHVSDVDEQVWHARIDLMVNAFRNNLPIPSLAWWEPDASATELKYRNLSLDQVSSRLFDSRAAIIRTLSNLAADDWYAPALHDTFGTLTVNSLPEKILLHDREHLESLM